MYLFWAWAGLQLLSGFAVSPLSSPLVPCDGFRAARCEAASPVVLWSLAMQFGATRRVPALDVVRARDLCDKLSDVSTAASWSFEGVTGDEGFPFVTPFAANAKETKGRSFPFVFLGLPIKGASKCRSKVSEQKLHEGDQRGQRIGGDRVRAKEEHPEAGIWLVNFGALSDCPMIVLPTAASSPGSSSSISS